MPLSWPVSGVGGSWTRRRVLKSIGALIFAGAGIEVLGRGLQNAPVPVATPASSGGPSQSLSIAERRAYRTRPDLTPPLITINRPAAAVAPGLIFSTPSNGAGHYGPTISDNAGDLIWLRPDSGSVSVTNFRVVAYRGNPTLAWWEGTVNGGIGSGEVVLLDDSYREVGRVRAGNGRPADLHEFLLTPSGTALLLADAGVLADRVEGGASLPTPVMDCAVQEIDVGSGRVLFEWHSVDHIALDESFVAAPDSSGSIYDYVHLNSIEIDHDGNLIVSGRNTSAVYKIDRSTGEILWRLGGKRSDFAMADDAAFSWQHDARRQADGTLTLFDDDASPSQSRAIVLELDEDAMIASLVRAYRHPNGLMATSQGNAQRLPDGNLFVGWGNLPFYSEFGLDGSLQLDATFPAAMGSYRGFRYEWVGRPTDLPAVVAEPASDGLTVYASWNGSTEVASWEVLGGWNPGDLRALATEQRSGFETAISVAARPKMVAVRARDRLSAILGTSAPIGAST